MDHSAQTEQLRSRLKLASLKTAQTFAQKYPQATQEFQASGTLLSKIREKSAKLLSASTLASVLLLNPPSATPVVAADLPQSRSIVSSISDAGKKETSQKSFRYALLEGMSSILPSKPKPLSLSDETELEHLFSTYLQVPTKSLLDGQHLNTTYGYIGAEQHLPRYPGDRLQDQGTGAILKEGITPGLGAWGYFSTSKATLTPELENIERWYAVVQTLYLPEWNSNTAFLREWYKYRKVLIVNTDNGNAVVAAIADSGPAAWTGKQFGGSPEVMMHLGGSRYKKGPVLVFFVNDPENKIPLGPVEYNDIQQAHVLVQAS
jgi:hypothetical protein